MAVKTITVKGTPIRKERTANAAITPGHLVEVMSTGNLRVHATAGGIAQRAFALEDDLKGSEIGTAYTALNRAQYGVFRSGDEVNAILANGETAVIGSPLESAGDGTLRVHQPEASATPSGVSFDVVGFALAALDLSGSSGADPASSRIIMEVV